MIKRPLLRFDSTRAVVLPQSNLRHERTGLRGRGAPPIESPDQDLTPVQQRWIARPQDAQRGASAEVLDAPPGNLGGCSCSYSARSRREDWGQRHPGEPWRSEVPAVC